MRRSLSGQARSVVARKPAPTLTSGSARSAPPSLVEELDLHDNAPRAMWNRDPRRAAVVPRQPFVDVRRHADVMASGITLAAEDVDESPADPLHAETDRMVRAVENSQELAAFGSFSRA